MATQTVTVSHTPATGASKSSGIPAAPGATDYSLTDLDLLEVPEAAAEDATIETGAPAARARTNGDAPEKGTAPPDENREATAEEKSAEDAAEKPTPAEFERAFELPGVGPKLREICERETAYREVFPTVAEARAVRDVFPNPDAARAAATAQAELARLDSLVESRDPRAHAELLAGLQRMAPEAFRSLALTFGERLASLDPEAHQQVAAAMAAQALAGQRWPEHVSLLSRAVEQQDWPAVKFLAATLSSQMDEWSRGFRTAPSARPLGAAHPRAAQPQPAAAPVQPAPSAMAEAANQFLQAVNADVEQAVQQSVAAKVEELLPDAPQGARQKIAAEIRRELDLALRQDPELLEQVRDSVRGVLRAVPNPEASGRDGRAGAGAERESVARLISSRARAALPGVARRVVADWSETVLRSSQVRRSRQSEAASRVEVGRGGPPAPVPTRPRGVDYTRMSDQEILNMD
jgi:hypothetical protein